METLLLENRYKIVVPVFGAAQQFYTDLGLYQQCLVLQKIVAFKDFSRPLSVFQVLFKANLIFKDFSRQSCIFKYFSSLCEPCKLITPCKRNVMK